ncbi:OVARIAN TUMOR DOMAIN-containing deubiquitinating enzyme 1 [Salvia hispanica]|uniref:OVARIAN TUMOR DOMAIN-containing deubiquitinating enzyme 1 n=1 Tax=Salvia hispanica TaxID=49212 RepID=UPI002008EF7C|nr:OVARIAN TUMOR DOMAIN-containing deubiquitinating enzyme 1 [Salvia hispanica]XP_047962378.1 OVARIAN TUMOR DOMAIN-containing deubiquitinating enzyme 1 [Salvia hispanica]XP_047962379.1 OVARIAN TUMOR DOMAIN-containing deubiquitinating enzyme 1 [Salvia hispanica]
MQNPDGQAAEPETETKISLQTSEINDWTNYRDDEVMQQHSAIQAEEAGKIPFVGDKEPLSSLADEYESGNPILLEKIKVLTEQYAAIRRTRGDGNCFFRGFMFAYLDHILESQDHAEIDRITVSVEECRKTLISLGYAEFTFEDFFALFLEQLESVLSGKEACISHEELVQRSRDQYVSDYVVMFFRFITSGEIKKRSEFYEPFIQGLTNTSVEQFCKSSVEPMGEESDHVHITALSDALGVPIRIVYLDRSHDDKGSVSVNHHDFIPVAVTDANSGGFVALKPFITLLYRPGHYDILYPK